MGEFEIEVCQVYEPMSLSVVEVLSLVEVGEVFVVSKDLNWEGGFLKVMPPSFQGVDYSEEFLIIHIVISFC